MLASVMKPLFIFGMLPTMVAGQSAATPLAGMPSRKVQTHVAYGVKLEREGQHVQAARHYMSALVHGPRDHEAMLRAAVFFAGRDVEKAAKLFEELMEAHPSSVVARTSFAQFVEKVRKNIPEARKIFDEAVELNPWDASAHNEYALFHDRAGEPELARAEFKKGLELDPRNEELRNNYALFLKNQKDASGAEAQLLTAIENNPASAAPRANYALLLQDRGDLAGAEEQLRMAAELSAPTRPYAFLALATFLEKKRGRHEEAGEILKQVLEANPHDGHSWHSYALFLKGRRDFVGMDEAWRRAVMYDPRLKKHWEAEQMKVDTWREVEEGSIWRCLEPPLASDVGQALTCLLTKAIYSLG